MTNIKKILIVCTGNACRSPMAEGFLKSYLKPENGFEIKSAGISAIDGFPPTTEAVKAMLEESIDISTYTSVPFSKDLAADSDIILVMSGYHKDFIINLTPGLESKVFLYNQFASKENNRSIADPIGQPISVYRAVRDEIKQATEAIVKKIKD